VIKVPNEIKKVVMVDAPPAVVFKALTDEKELVQWMPKEAKMDARVGGQYEFKYYRASRNLEAVAKGEILELVPGKRLSYTFDSMRGGSAPSLAKSVVTWTLEELPSGKTMVTLVHSGITEELAGDTDMGWGHYTAQLAAHCAKVMAVK